MGAISRQSVFIDLTHPVENYNTNNTVLGIYGPTGAIDTENRFTPRGIFKRVDIQNSNLTLAYNLTDYLARYEPADLYTASDLLGTDIEVIGGKRFIIEPSVINGKYNIGTIGDNQTFANVSTSNVSYWDTANIDISKLVTLPTGRSVNIYGESFTEFRLSQNGYMVFAGSNVHTIKWLASDDDQFNVRPGVIGSNVNIKYLNDGNSTNGADNVLLINYATNDGTAGWGTDWGKSGINNAEIRLYLDNTANGISDRITVNYSDSTSNLGSPAQYLATKYAVRGLESTVNSYTKDSRLVNVFNIFDESNTVTYYLPGSEIPISLKSNLDSNVLVMTRTIPYIDGVPNPTLAGSTMVTDMTTLTSGVSGDKFGYSISQSGTRFVVGAPGDTTSVVGNVYVYDNTGEYLGYLYSSNIVNTPGSYSQFGKSVAIWDNRIIVGAPTNLPSGNGSAHVFDWNGTNWINSANLVSSLSNASGFGTACSIYNSNLVMIGAPGTVTSIGQSGSVHFFEWNGSTWSEQYNIAPHGLGNMGNSVAIWGNIAVAGSPTSSIGVGDSGNVYVYQQNTSPGGAWTNTQVLKGSDWSGRTVPGLLTPHTDFGYSLDMDDDWLIVGYPGYTDIIRANAGPAYYYKKQTNHSLSFDMNQFPGSSNIGKANDRFGTTVSLYRNPRTSNGYGVITSTGNAYVYTTSDLAIPFFWNYANLNYANTNTGFGISAVIDPIGRVVIGSDGDVFINQTAARLNPVSNATINGAPGSNEQYGSALTIASNTLAIGASAYGGNGAVYLYGADNTTVSSWSNTVILTPSGLNNNCSDTLFGYAMDSSVEWLAISAYKYSTPTALLMNGFRSGNVYVYDNTTKTLTHTIEPPTTPSDGYFGKSLSIEANTMVIGAPGQSVSGSHTCLLYTSRRG